MNSDLLVALKAASGYLMNAKIDLETGTKKATTLGTINGGLKVVREAIKKAAEGDWRTMDSAPLDDWVIGLNNHNQTVPVRWSAKHQGWMFGPVRMIVKKWLPFPEPPPREPTVLVGSSLSPNNEPPSTSPEASHQGDVSGAF